MSRDRTRPGDDALSDSERARRELEKRLRAALIEGEEPIRDEAEQEDDAPLPLTDRVEDAPEVLAEIAPVAVEEAPAATPVEAPAEPAPAAQSPAEPTQQAPAEPAPQAPAERIPQPNLWNRLPRIPVDPARMERNLVITANRHDPAHAAFDVLRTRMIQAMRDKGWHRVGITSPTAGCGKSFTAINLGVSLSRLNDFRTVLLDFDLHRPGLSRILGLKDMPATADFLRGEIGAEDYLSTFAPNMLNIGDRLALGVNGRVEPFASELFANPRSAEVIARMQTDLQADLVLFDLPPALAMDDVLALRPHLDCVLIVVGGGETRARDMREVQSRLGDDMPILGVVMNKAEVDGSAGYSYGY